MNDTIIYRPYRSHGWFVPFSIAIGILAFAVAGFCIPNMGLTIIFSTTVGILSLCLAKVLYDSSNIVVFFELGRVHTTAQRLDSGRFSAILRSIP